MMQKVITLKDRVVLNDLGINLDFRPHNPLKAPLGISCTFLSEIERFVYTLWFIRCFAQHVMQYHKPVCGPRLSNGVG